MLKTTLKVRVKPSARQSQVISKGEVWEIKLKSPPKEGLANAELIEIISRELNIPKSYIEIVSGLRSKIKTVKIG
ncbi:DUF167 domain-containing protein [Candidatus Parcubacteria bacterium]|nr:MAG: DUF167 domain-containing protein [Candidatus Parcubacteria bacterium]